MECANSSAVVTGGASGLGLATVRRLLDAGARVVIADLPSSAGADVARSLAAQFGGTIVFQAADVTDADSLGRAFDAAVELAPLRVLVHCAGRGATVRVVEKDGSPGSLETFREIIDINLVGTFNALRLAASRMVVQGPANGERGVCVLTASVAAWEGQIGQMPYASAKAGVVGMTLVAARDLARSLVRVNAIAPGIFDTPILSRFGSEVLAKLGGQIPNPARLGRPDEFAHMVMSIIGNPYLNGETIRLDGAVRMAPR